MPKEDRRIIFSYDEVYKAIYTLSVAKQLPKLPPGAITHVEEKDGAIIVKLENPGEGTTEMKEFSTDFFAAALMVFCRGEGIPLPRSAQKSVMIRDGEVILRATI